jgi:hypothetical protein
LEKEEGATSQGMRVASRSWKRLVNRFSSGAFRSNAALDSFCKIHFGFFPEDF